MTPSRFLATASRRSLLVWTLAAGLALACGSPGPKIQDLEAVPLPDLEAMAPSVREQLADRHQALETLRQEALDPSKKVARPRLAAAYGELGQLFHAYQLAEAAEPAYRDAAALDPKDLRWPYYLADLHQARGELEKAETNFRAVLKLEPQHLGANLRLGRLLLDLDRLDEAKKFLDLALKLDPSCAPAHFSLGKIAAAQGDSAGAIVHFEKALELQPQASIVRYPLAQAYREQGNLEAAQRNLDQRGTARLSFDDPLLRQLTDLAAGSAAFLTQAGAESRQGLVSEAIESYRQAVAADPNNATARRDLAFALAQAGRLDEAEPELRKALEIDPASPLLHNALGVIQGQQGKLQEALASFKRAVEGDGRFEDALFNLASAQAQLGRSAEALASLERVLAINPQRAQAYQLRATVLAQGGQLEAAKSALDQAVQLAPGDLGGRQLLAEIATRLGDRGTAVAQYEAILAAEPSRESQARLHLLAADLLREERQLERALTHYRQALEADPQLADARFNLASMLGLLNRSEEALPHFRTLVEGAPDNEIFRLSEATALAFAGRYGELKRRLDEGIEAVPQSAALGQLLSRLLAAAPDPAVREPARSLALAKEAYAARPTPASAETLAIAFAATGDFAKAADIQNQLLDRLGPKADADSRQRWQARLKRYKAQQDCCVDGAANRAVAEMLFAGLYSG